jgi:hypothetical protein
LESKYIYHGIDITLDIYEKLCSVIEMISEKENKTFDECYALLSSSPVYESLQNEESLMWSESAEYIADEYYRTLDGDPKCQKYL